MANINYDEEATKLSFDDLAPSLQTKIRNLANVDQFKNTANLINAINSRTKGKVVTEGAKEPINGQTLGQNNIPLTVTNDNNIHYNTNDQVLEYFHDRRWNRHHLVYE